MMSWSQAAAFCNALSDLDGLNRCYECSGTGEFASCDLSADYNYPFFCPGYRLPTESEWELAARSGTSGPSYGDLDDIAWYVGNAERSTHEVGTREPSPWGLYDMLGNVAEYCHDWYGEYPDDHAIDPIGPETGTSRTWRGGSYLDESQNVRAARREWSPRGGTTAGSSTGFRPVRSIRP